LPRLYNIPLSWFKTHFIDDILVNWQRTAPSANGFFYPDFNRKWERCGKPIATLVSQSRLLYVFSNGYLLTKASELLDAVNAGGSFLLESFFDEKEGGFVWACNESGEKTDFTKDAYGHAFTILGLVYAYKASNNKDYLKTALDVSKLLSTNFTDEYGGLTWKMSRDWNDLDENRSQNPIMHAFEAFLALQSVLRDEDQKQMIKDKLSGLFEFLFSRVPPGDHLLLPEIYTRSWDPIHSNEGGYISVGHLFEWAFLLSEGLKTGMDHSTITIANKLLDSGLSLGYENEKGYIKTWIDEKGNVIRDEISWWEQSEALRALIHFIEQHNRKDLTDYFKSIFQFVKDHFLDPIYGGWYTNLYADGSPLDTNKGSVRKLDYHQTALCIEAVNQMNKL